MFQKSFSISTLTVALSAVAGCFAATAEWPAPMQAAVALESSVRSENSLASLEAESEVSTTGVNSADQLALADRPVLTSAAQQQAGK